MSHVFDSTWLKSNVKIICVNGSVQSDLPIRPDWTEPYRGPGSSGLVESLMLPSQMVLHRPEIFMGPAGRTSPIGSQPPGFRVAPAGD